MDCDHERGRCFVGGTSPTLPVAASSSGRSLYRSPQKAITQHESYNGRSYARFMRYINIAYIICECDDIRQHGD